MKSILLLALLLCAGCSGRSAPSFDTVMKLHDGQTYAQVVEIMGKPTFIEAKQFDDKYCVKVGWTWGKEPFVGTMRNGVGVAIENGLVTKIFVDGIDPPYHLSPQP